MGLILEVESPVTMIYGQVPIKRVYIWTVPPHQPSKPISYYKIRGSEKATGKKFNVVDSVAR
jgi:hypothetical protein